MTKVLVTAFEPYGDWQTNASWLSLMELTKNMPEQPEITTRLYPVEFDAVKRKLEEDLIADFDYALHLGQSPGATAIALESTAINMGGDPEAGPDGCEPLLEGGPTAYRTSLPLQDWAEQLRRDGIPAQVSHHAGTYLCNATLYFSQHIAKRMGLKTLSAFVHVPLDVSQAAQQQPVPPSLPASLTAAALGKILTLLAEPAVL